jgi:hypothetical protein
MAKIFNVARLNIHAPTEEFVHNDISPAWSKYIKKWLIFFLLCFYFFYLNNTSYFKLSFPSKVFLTGTAIERRDVEGGTVVRFNSNAVCHAGLAPPAGEERICFFWYSWSPQLCISPPNHDFQLSPPTYFSATGQEDTLVSFLFFFHKFSHSLTEMCKGFDVLG